MEEEKSLRKGEKENKGEYGKNSVEIERRGKPIMTMMMA